jgi:hypothetical protein
MDFDTVEKSSIPFEILEDCSDPSLRSGLKERSR